MRLVLLTDEEIRWMILWFVKKTFHPNNPPTTVERELEEKLQACLKGEVVEKQLELALKETARNKRWFHTDYIRMLDNTFIVEAMEKLRSYLGE